MSSDRDIRRQRRFVGAVHAGHIRDLAFARLPVEPFHVALLADRKWRIDEDLDEIMSLADRIAVMYEGRIVAVIPAESADRETIGLLMGGSQLEATS